MTQRQTTAAEEKPATEAEGDEFIGLDLERLRADGSTHVIYNPSPESIAENRRGAALELAIKAHANDRTPTPGQAITSTAAAFETYLKGPVTS